MTDGAKNGEIMNPHFSDVEYLLDGFEHVETTDDFRKRVALGRPLRIKLGIDPTSPDLHLGFMVVLHALQRFSEAGHDVTLIIGDFTARIGDPSGRNVTRPTLSSEEIEANMKTYREQAGKVLDLERVKVRYNSEWLDKLGLPDLIRLLSKTTVAQMLERNDFQERYSGGTAISLHEFLYPVAQAYDSIAIEADVELGGTDQLFNLLLGRQYQREYGQLPQICATVPLLVGLDGTKKMSKSYGNYVGIAEPAEDQFGKLMKISDELMPVYARLAAFRNREDSDRLAADVAANRVNPMDEKKRLAEEIVTRYHGAQAAHEAREHFERTVQRKEMPSGELPEIAAEKDIRVAELLVKAGFADGRRAAERLISGNGVRIDGTVVSDPKALWSSGGSAVLSVGTRKFVRIRSQEKA
jgi:tyrosyl-tRNA synthetase